MGKILVTGATGNVGSHVVAQLASAGIDVRAFARRPERVQPGVEAVQGDLTAPETLEPALKDVESVFLLWPGLSTGNAAEVVSAIAGHARRVVYLSAFVPGGSGGTTGRSRGSSGGRGSAGRSCSPAGSRRTRWGGRTRCGREWCGGRSGRRPGR
ncbi:SDR family oxidoreductase [Nonomuraea rubra]|uniref:SDR family oxidoreductase n=1 Tax=Nonomuraea rubra TaxID=46180 RepID=UPI0036152EE1